jgi:3-dehydroquinate synthase
MEMICRLNNTETRVEFTDMQQVLELVTEALVVTDEHVAALLPYRPEHLLILSPGEAHKQWSSIEMIITAALEMGLGRDGRMVGIGGGVVCDMTAFAASIYMRGIRVDLVPTTLLSMVDASLGGKTGTDFNRVKNIIGTFHPAGRVFICTEMLASLDQDEYKNGLAEVIKHAFLQGGRLLEQVTESRSAILDRSGQFLDQLVYDSLLVKRDFITSDPQEKTGIRAKLNFGHTFGHALETLTGLTSWSHGEAVAWGMARALEAGSAVGVTDKAYAESAVSLLRSYGFDTDYRIETSRIPDYLRYLSSDKKKLSGRPQFILQRNAGDTIITELPEQVIVAAVSSSQR